MVTTLRRKQTRRQDVPATARLSWRVSCRSRTWPSGYLSTDSPCIPVRRQVPPTSSADQGGAHSATRTTRQDSTAADGRVLLQAVRCRWRLTAAGESSPGFVQAIAERTVRADRCSRRDVRCRSARVRGRGAVEDGRRCGQRPGRPYGRRDASPGCARPGRDDRSRRRQTLSRRALGSLRSARQPSAPPPARADVPDGC